MTADSHSETNDGETFIVSRHLERLHELIPRYRGWFACDNDAEAVAMIIADARLVLRDLDANVNEVDRFVTAINLRRVSRCPDAIEVPRIACDTTLDDLTAD